MSKMRTFVLALFFLSGTTLTAQTQRSTHWHLPLDEEAFRVAQASEGVLVPSVQPMTMWNRPDTLKPQEQGFQGLLVLGEVRQMFGDLRAAGTGIGLGGSGTFGLRGAYHVAASRWRMPLGFPLAREVADHGSMDGLGRAILLNESVASIDRLEGAVSWAVSFRGCSSRTRKPPLGPRRDRCSSTVTWPRRWALVFGSMQAWCSMPRPSCAHATC